jgi:type I restriction enzyme S subunit
MHTEMNGELPEGWSIATIGDVATRVVVGYVGPCRQDYDPDGVPFLMGKNIRAGGLRLSDLERVNHSFHEREKKSQLVANDVVVVRIGRSGTAAVIPDSLGPANCGGLIIVKNPQAVLSNYIVYYLNSPAGQKASLDETRGVTRQTLNTKSIEAASIPVAPTVEQQVIVTTLQALLTKVDTCQKRLAAIPRLLKRFRQAVLSAACSGRLTEDWRTAIGSFESPRHVLDRVYRRRLKEYEQECHLAAKSGDRKPRKPENLQPQLREPEGDQIEMPDSWMRLSLRDVAASHRYAMSSGPFGSALGTKDYRSSGIPVIRGQNIQAGRFTFGNLVFVSESKANELIRSTAYPDDIVVVAVGTSGQAAVVPETINRAVLSQNCNKITTDKSIAVPLYVASFLQIGAAKEQLKEKTTDTARPFLSLTNLKGTLISVPPLSEQHEIVRRIDALFRFADTVERHVAGATLRADKLTQSILAKAFRGELVPTEAELARREGREFEPAYVLLERTKAERASQSIGKRSHKRTRRKARVATAKG